MGLGERNASKERSAKGTMLTPRDLGLPAKFVSWRDNQEDMISEYLDSKQPYLAQCAPTGSGKSVTAVTDAALTGGKAVILTSTKALQAQYLGDFSEIGAVEIKGKNSYRCRMDPFGRGCDYGDCNFGLNCEYASRGCAYYDALRVARASKIVVSNYAYWLTMNFHQDGFYPNDDADLLVLDEAHHADHHVVDLLTFHIKRKEAEQSLSMTTPTSASYVKLWAKQALDKASQAYGSMAYSLKERNRVSHDELRRMKALKMKLEFLDENAHDQDWMLEFYDGVKISPVWPKEHAKKMLFGRAKRTLMMSATVRPKTVEMLGLNPEPGKGDDLLRAEILRAQVEGDAERGNKSVCLFSDYPSIFEPERRLVLHVPTVRMNHRTPKEDIDQWMKRIDQIITPRLHQKGIIHTVSYDRAEYVISHSEHAEHMITHMGGNVIDVVGRFKESPAPCVLVSPSVMTGFDFPYDQCRWMIIGKIPFPDTRDRLTKARLKKDPEYGAYLAMQSLVQASGRGTRAPNDSCVTFLIDDSAFWFMKRYRHFAPRWFMDGYRVSNLIPQAE